MKRTLATTLLGVLIALSTNAKTLITMCDCKGQPTSCNSGVPIVFPKEDGITIKSDTLLSDAEIVIRDQFGNVIHHSVENIGPMETTIFVPEDDGFNKKATIDLYYDRRRFCGNFNE